MTTTKITAALFAAAALPAAAQTELRFAHMNSPDHFVNEAGAAMAERVAEQTDGAVLIEMFPSGQIGENAQVTEQIAFGGELMGQVGPGTIASYVPDFGILPYPFLYEDWDDAKKLLSSDLFDGIEARAAEEHNIKVLCYFAFGIRDLYTRETEVMGPEDSAGLKIRVQPVTLYTEMVRNVFDAAPTPMPWPEVYSALAQGVIDAAEAPPAAILDQKHHENAQYLVQTNHILDISPIIISNSAFAALSSEHQEIVQSEADAMCAEMTETALSGYEDGVRELEANGMTVISDVDKAAFAERADAIAESFPEWSDGLYDRAKAAISEE